MRYYDPINGKLQMKGDHTIVDWKDLDLNQLRAEIGYVKQQPVLIGNTIRQAVGGEHY